MATSKTTKKEEVKIDIPLKGVYAKLQTARIALMNEGLKKTGKNDFAHFEFFQLVDFLPEAQKLFAKLGLTTNYTLAPRVIANKEIVEGEKIIREPIIKDIARLVIRDIESGDIEIFEMEAAPVQIGNNTKQNIYQAAGGRSTYYKRYLYRDALEIEESDESDAVLGAPEVNYQAPVKEVTPKKVPKAATVQPQPTTIQQDIIQPQNNITPEVVQNDESDVNPNAILSQSSREEVMKILNDKGLINNALDILSKYCSQNGIGAPGELKESDKNGLLTFINNL